MHDGYGRRIRAGVRGFTCTSGPGLSLMAESLSWLLADLPMVVIDVQRSGPSTGMATKVEQSDIDAAATMHMGLLRYHVLNIYRRMLL